MQRFKKLRRSPFRWYAQIPNFEQLENTTAIDHGILSKTVDFNTSYERPLSKLSENHQFNVIGQTELKVWPFKFLTVGPLKAWLCN